MKIIQIMPEFGLAGAEIMCENLSYGLVRLGHEVIVISCYNFNSPITERLEKAGIKVIYLGKKKGLDLSLILKLRKIFKKEKPNIIHTHRYIMIYTTIAALGLKIGKIHTIHNVANKEVGKIYRKIFKLYYKTNNIVPVALSETIKKTIEKEYSIPSKKIPVIFNGVNLNYCKVKKNYNVSEVFNILNIARFSKQKNHKRLLEAFEIIINKGYKCRLHLIGDGELRTEIENEVKEKKLQDKVIFYGLQKNIYSFLQQADLFVLSSDYEGIPMTLIEAMGTGLPIVSTKVGGIADMIKNNESGLLCELSSLSLAEKMEIIIKDVSVRSYLGNNAKISAIPFSVEKTANEYEKIYYNIWK